MSADSHPEQDVVFVVSATTVDAVVTAEVAAEPLLATPVEADGAVDRLREAIGTLGEALGGRLDRLQSLFEREVRAEATREKVVDRLHSELQEYKQDLLLKALRPLLIDLIQLHDDIGKMAPTDGDAGEIDRLGGVQQGIEDILYRQGVEPFAVEDDAFDPRRQRAVATVPTDDPALNRRVAARHRKGFQAGDRVIRPEVVSVWASRR